MCPLPAWKPPTVPTTPDKGQLGGVSAVIYGPVGSGKTTFAVNCHSEGGKTLLLATDANHKPLRLEKYPIDIKDWRDFEWVSQNADPTGFDTVAVDTVGALVQLAIEHACRHFGVNYPEEGPGKNGSSVWAYVRNLIGISFTRLQQRFPNSVWLAHEASMEVLVRGKGKIPRAYPNLKTTANEKLAWVTSIWGRAFIEDDGSRWLDFKTCPEQDAKDTSAIFAGTNFRCPMDGRTFFDAVVGKREML